MSVDGTLAVSLAHGRAFVASPALARLLNLEHDALLRAIRAMECPEAMHRHCFIPASRKRQPAYRIVKDGFVLLTLQTGEVGERLRDRGAAWVSACLHAFVDAERQLAARPPRKPRMPSAAPAAPPPAAPQPMPEAASGPVPAPAGGLLPVPFRGATLYIVDLDGEPYVPMRPVVEGMGLAWKPQYLKLVEDKQRFCVTEMVTQMPGDDQNRQVVCIPLRKVAAWLMTISPNKVRPELREKILAYQNECDEVLWRYWSGQTVSRQAPKVAVRKAPKAGPYVLDDHFTARLYVALDRKYAQTQVVRRLLTLGALDDWIVISARDLARIEPRMSSSATHKAVGLLARRGLLTLAPRKQGMAACCRLSGAALADLLGRTGRIHLNGSEAGVDGLLEELRPGRPPRNAMGR